MNSISLAEVKPGAKFLGGLYLDNLFLLLPPSVPAGQDLLTALAKWNFEQMLSSDTPPAPSSGAPAPSPAPKKAVLSGKFEEVTDFDDESKHRRRGSEFAPELKAAIQREKEAIKGDTSKNSDSIRIKLVSAIYDRYMEYIKKVYTHYATHKKIDLEDISCAMRELCLFIRDYRRYVLRITPSMEARNRDFLVVHSMRSTVLAITIAQEINMPLTQMIELADSCLLHEIGMIQLPPQLYLNEKLLSPQEKAKIVQHPLLGYKILKEANCPQSIQLGVLDHHERQNSTGYPRRLDGSKISLFGKIIAVACAFEATTAPRHYKEAKSSYDAMVEMLKNEQQAYDDTVIKALLYSLSLFPIGEFVCLSTGRVAQVVDVSPGNPRNPLVQIVGEFGPDGNPKVVQSNETDMKIVRALTKKESDGLIKKLKALGK